MEYMDKESAKVHPLNILKMIGFIIWAILPLNFIMIMMMLQDITPSYLKWILSLIWIIFAVFSIYWLWNYYKKISKDTVQKMARRDIGIAVLLFLLLRGVAIGGTMLINILYGESMTANDAALQISDPLAVSPIYYILFYLTIGIVAPIIEELVFRGIFTNLFFNKYAKWAPALITSFVFSLMHSSTNIVSFTLYFIMGLVFFFAYYRRRNMKDSILVHILNNSLLMIVSIIYYLILLLS